jgi:hypothetical protein
MASEFVKTSVNNLASVQTETGPSVILKVSLILTSNVKFILTFKQTLFQFDILILEKKRPVNTNKTVKCFNLYSCNAS